MNKLEVIALVTIALPAVVIGFIACSLMIGFVVGASIADDLVSEDQS